MLSITTAERDTAVEAVTEYIGIKALPRLWYRGVVDAVLGAVGIAVQD